MSEEHQVEQSAEPQVNATEEKARALGWVPKDEFRGDESKWRDADAFLERGERVLPILKENNDRLFRELSELKATMRQFKAHHENVSKREYERAKKDLLKQQEQAVEEGDKDKFREVSKELQDLETARPIPTPDPVSDWGFNEWVNDNQWFNNDPELREYALQACEYLARTKPHLTGKAQADEAAKLTRKTFPDKFSNPARSSAASVAGSSQSGAGNKGKKGYHDLPSDAKQICDQFVKQGLLTRDKYVKEYFGE